jgi:hypothetical protein
MMIQWRSGMKMQLWEQPKSRPINSTMRSNMNFELCWFIMNFMNYELCWFIMNFMNYELCWFIMNFMNYELCWFIMNFMNYELCWFIMNFMNYELCWFIMNFMNYELCWFIMNFMNYELCWFIMNFMNYELCWILWIMNIMMNLLNGLGDGGVQWANVGRHYYDIMKIFKIFTKMRLWERLRNRPVGSTVRRMNSMNSMIEKKEELLSTMVEIGIRT